MAGPDSSQAKSCYRMKSNSLDNEVFAGVSEDLIPQTLRAMLLN